MRPETRKVLLSTTSAAALAILATGAQAQTTINGGLTTTQQVTSSTGDLTLTGGATLQVDGAPAVLIDDNGRTITNSNGPGAGSILGTGAGGGGVKVNAGVTGFTINNNSNGLIQSQATGTAPAVQIEAGAGGTINNAGQIQNTYTGASGVAAILLNGVTDVSINNSAAAANIFSAQGPAIYVGGATSGSIANSGTINSGNGGTYAGATIDVQGAITGGITNNAGATIKAGANGGNGATAINVGASTNITNAGTIQQTGGGTNGTAIFFGGDYTSTIDNKSTGVISSTGTGTAAGAISFATNADIAGSITNAGQIVASGSNASAIYFENDSSLTGGIANTGTIEATDNSGASTGRAITIDSINDNALTINNNANGIIRGTGQTAGAIYVTSGFQDVTINNATGATITTSTTNGGAAHTIYVTLGAGNATTTINNNGGTISNTGSATNTILVDGGAKFAINNNAGTISGGGGSTHTIRIDGGVGDINNADGATITGDGSGSTLRVASNGMTGKIDNAGTIENTSGQKAINLAGTVTGGLFNRSTGTITGDVAIGQNTFTIEGGIVDGKTTGGNASTVNFNLASISVVDFEPHDGPYGFETSGAFDLAQGGTSAINVNSGALLVNHDLTADTLTIAGGAAMRLNDVTVNTSGAFTNNGLLFVDGRNGFGPTTIIAGGNVAFAGTGGAGEGNFLGLGIHHDPGTNDLPLLQIQKNGGFGGALTFDGNSKVRIYNYGDGYTPGEGPTVVVTTQGGINTTPAMDTAFNDTATLAYSVALVNSSKDLALTITRTPFNSALHGFTPNQNNVGGALETIGANSDDSGNLTDLLGFLDSLKSENALGNALQQLLPVNNGAALYGSMVGFDSMMQSIDSRLANFGGMTASAPGRTGLSGANGGPLNNVWVRGGGAFGEQDSQRGRIGGFDGRTYYGVVGLDREIGEGLRVGGSFAYADSKFDGQGTDAQNSRTNVKNYQGSVYGAWNSAATGWFATAVLGGGGSHYEQRRHAVLRDDLGDIVQSDTKSADYNGWQVTGKGIVGMAFGNPNGPTLAPFASFRYTHIHLNGYTEQGQFDDDLSLTVKDQSYNQALPGVGVRLAAPFQSGGMTLLPWIRATYQYDLIGDRQVLNSTFGGDVGIPQTSFRTEGLQPGRHVFNAGGGVNVFAGQSFSMSLNYDFEKRNDGFTGHSGFIQARLGF